MKLLDDVFHTADLGNTDTIIDDAIIQYLRREQLIELFLEETQKLYTEQDFMRWVNSYYTVEHRSAPTVSAYQIDEFRKKYYARLRKGAYPDITNYLDAVVKDDAQQLEKYKQDCLTVKARFPK